MTTRSCTRCGQPTETTRGKATCETCRRNPVCSKCGEPRKLAATYCPPCTKAYNAARPAYQKTCRDCGTSFRSKAASDYCNQCQHERRKHPCQDCGVRIDSRAKVCRRCFGHRNRGANNYAYKGGRVFKTVHGYVLRLAHGHPKANNGYVREHVLIMEQQVGRYLLPGETVHHKNGVKDDNRPENLELWSGSQPAGQRVEDKAAWARELLGLYGTADERARYACLPDTNLASA